MRCRSPWTGWRCVEFGRLMSRPIYPDQTQESSIIDLANECSRFVTGYFDIISASAPHIYHSALVLTPKTSIVRKLYEAHAHPFVRVVHGASMLWDPNTAAAMRPRNIEVAVWSQCGKFIAIAQKEDVTVDILDSVTLQRLQTLELPQGMTTFRRAFVFSPDSRMLTASCCGGDHSNREPSVISWDLQTGGLVGIIERREPCEIVSCRPSITYSANGKLVAVCYWHPRAVVISISDVVSGVYLHSHLLDSPFGDGDLYYGDCLAEDDNFSSDSSSDSDGGSVWDGSRVSKRNLAPNDFPVSDKSNVQVSNNIWTHGESLRFATVGPTTITIWEVGFASESPPTEVETLPVPDSVRTAIPFREPKYIPEQVQFLPASCRLAIIHQGKVLVWDTRNYKSLLSQTDTRCCPGMSFSSDGRFFACSTTGYEILLWKESPTGYVLHRTLASSTGNPSLLLSPSGESIVTFGDRTIRLWHTKSFTAPTSSISTQTHQSTGDFILDFSPDRTSAITARREDSVIRVLDLESGALQLTIDAGMGIYGLRVIEDGVAVVGDGKVITWNIPAGDRIPNARMNVDDSTRAINFSSPGKDKVFTASISPDLHHVSLATPHVTRLITPELRAHCLRIYTPSAGGYPEDSIKAGPYLTTGNTTWFAPDGRSLWCVGTGEFEPEMWMVTAEHGLTSPLGESGKVDTEHPPEGYPWGSSHGYRATDDGWVFGPDGKRLLMLPSPWQSAASRRVWNGRILALLHGALPEPVILELDS